MTTVAYKDGIMAADRQTDVPSGNAGVTKLKRRDDAVYAGTGCSSDIAALADWYFSNRMALAKYTARKNDDPNAELLVMHDDGRVFWTGWGCSPSEVSGFVAIGSGAEYAVGAMARGAHPGEAVEIAARFDESTGQGVDVARCRHNVVKYPESW